MTAAKGKSVLTETSEKVGKALARSSHKVEEAGEKLKKTAKTLAKNAAHKVEETVEETVGKVKKEVSSLTKKKDAGCEKKNSPLNPAKGMTVEGSIGFLAGDIYQYLTSNGSTAVDKIVKVMQGRTYNESLINAALGWLAREAKIRFSKDGSKVSLL